MWHKVEWMGRPMRLELTRVGLLGHTDVYRSRDCKLGSNSKKLRILIRSTTFKIGPQKTLLIQRPNVYFKRTDVIL